MSQNLRALRRHHTARLKKARRFYHGRDLEREPKRRGQALATPAPCSCWMCGNPRHHDGEATRQERCARAREQTELDDLLSPAA